MATPRVHTYHCTFCSHLLLASTHLFSTLPTRKPPGLDHATIVPLPPPPKSEPRSDDESSSSSDSSDSEPEPEPELEPQPEPRTSTSAPPASSSTNPPLESVSSSSAPLTQKRTQKQKATDKDAYTLLLFLVPDRSSKIITREDGFEKRHQWRCGRCRLLIGYQLDDVHYSLGPNSNTHANTIRTTGIMGGNAGAENDRNEKERRRMANKKKRFLYVLPGAVVRTEELEKGGEERVVDIVRAEV